MEIEHFFTCPYCWQTVSFVLGLSIDEQTYIEDCEVCCRPIQAGYTTENFDLKEFWADVLEQ